MKFTRASFTVALALSLTTAPLDAEAQKQERPARIGRLSPLSAAADLRSLEAFREGLRDLGWTEDKNLIIEQRFAEGHFNRLPDLAAELARLGVAVIVAGSSPAARAAMNATANIPIVFATTGNPVADGLIGSLARPGGHVTGVTALGQELGAKRLEVLKQAVHGITRVAVLANPASPYTAPTVKGLEDASRALGMLLSVLEVQHPTEFENAFAAMSSARMEALMVLPDIMLATHRRTIVDLAAKSRLPTMYGTREYVDDGGLMFYGESLADMHRRVATYVDKILRGAKAGDLPIERPVKFDLVINLRTAKALGLVFPPSLLMQAQVVE